MKCNRIKILGFMLTLALVIGLLPGMSLTAYADDPYASLKNTTTVVHFDSKEWYLIDYDSSTVTLLLKECVAASQYDSNGSSYIYNGSTVESTVNNWYTQNITANAQTAVVDNKMFLLTIDQANAMTVDTRKCSRYTGTDTDAWWLCSPGYTDSRAAYVFGDDGEVDGDGYSVEDTLAVRPALKLNLELESVIFSSETNTFTVGSATESSTYTITIPDTLTVQNIGWNELEGGITASGDLESGKKLVITASSDNNFNFVKSGDNTQTVSYDFRASSTDLTPITTWEFTSLSSDVATTKTAGINIADYSTMPAGTYQDTVTFTAAVENTSIPVESVTITNAPTEALFVNSTGTLTATVLPNDATDKTVTWSSDNPNHVKIDAATGEYTVTGVDGYGSATITATAGDKTDTCTITGKVHHTSLQAGDIIRVGETIYTGSTWYVNITPNTSFTTNNGVITLVEATTGSTKYYKFSRGTNGSTPNWTSFKVTDNTDGLYIVSGTGTNSDKFVFAVHMK